MQRDPIVLSFIIVHTDKDGEIKYTIKKVDGCMTVYQAFIDRPGRVIDTELLDRAEIVAREHDGAHCGDAWLF